MILSDPELYVLYSRNSLQHGLYMEKGNIVLFSFVVFLPLSIFFFTHHMDPIIEEVKYDVEVAFDSIAIQVYDPPLFCAYVCLLETELAKTREALAQALHDCAHAEKEARKWFLIRDYSYKKMSGWKPPHPPMPPSSLIHLILILMILMMSFLGNLMKKFTNKRGRKSKSLKLDII